MDQKYIDGYVNHILKNVKVYWAHVHQPDTAFGGDKWKLDAALTEEAGEELKALGFTINSKTYGQVEEPYVLVPKKERIVKGIEQKPPVIVGADGKTPFTQDIGNGSVCNLKLSCKAWKIKGKWILATYLDAVQIVKHVEYSGGGAFEDCSEESTDVPF